MSVYTPREMVERAVDELGYFSTNVDMQRISNGIPSDVPWGEEGMEFVIAMVIGYYLNR